MPNYLVICLVCLFSFLFILFFRFYLFYLLLLFICFIYLVSAFWFLSLSAFGGLSSRLKEHIVTVAIAAIVAGAVVAHLCSTAVAAVIKVSLVVAGGIFEE